MGTPSRRVVITGMGLISPFGNTKEELWQALLERRSAVAPLTSLPTDYLPVSYAAEARDFSGGIDGFGPLPSDKKKAIRKALKVMCREIQMGIAAAQRTLQDASLAEGAVHDPDRVGIVFGSDYMLTVPEEFAAGVRACLDEAGEFQFRAWTDQGMEQLAPLWLLKYLPNMPASHVAIFNDLRGPNNSLTLREASSNAAAGEAFRVIQRGHAEAMIAGSTGTRVHPMKTIHTIQSEEIADRGLEPEQASRPFEKHRTGMVLGEGAGAILLEEFEAAKNRGAHIWGEVVGYGCSSVANRRGVAGREQALANAVHQALSDAGFDRAEVGHIHAHGLGTRSCDVEEARAIGRIWEDRSTDIPVVALKSYCGNLGAGSGLIEIMASLLSLREGHLFATLNYDEPDPDCPIRVTRSGEEPAGQSFLNLNVTPQGQATALVVRTA